MKFILPLLLFLANLAQARVPSNWIQGNNSSLHVNFVDDSENAFGQDIQKLITSTYGFVSPSLTQQDEFGLTSVQQKSKPGPWYLASIKTELGIGLDGEIGMVGAEGAAAVEYIWKRSARSIAKLQRETYKNVIETPAQKERTFIGSNTVHLTTEMSPSEIERSIDHVIEYAKKSGQVRSTDKMKYQLTQHLELHQLYARQLARNAQNMMWQPYKYQLELFVTAAGFVVPTIEVGGVLRLRIEWNIIEQNNFLYAPSQLAESLNFLGSQLAQNLDTEKSEFALYGIKVGLGTGLGGDIGVVEAKTHAIASVFLRYKPQAKLMNGGPIQIPPRNMIQRLSVMQWQRGLQKAADMTSFIVQESSLKEREMDRNRPYREFELGAIEIEIELSAGGEMFLPTVKGIAFLEIFLNKKNPLKP